MKLKPCPFCGGAVKLIYIGNDHTPRRRVAVEHIKKGCPVKFKNDAMRYSHEWLASKVAEAWNKRVTESEYEQ